MGQKSNPLENKTQKKKISNFRKTKKMGVTETEGERWVCIQYSYTVLEAPLPRISLYCNKQGTQHHQTEPGTG